MSRNYVNEGLAVLAGIGIGAAVMYFLDPQRGNARRTQLADQTAARLRGAKRDVEWAGRDLGNRAHGAAAEVRGRLREEIVDDDVLTERVRAELGHHGDSVRRVEVSARNGRVTLRGEVAPEDHVNFVHAARHVRGVDEVEDQLVDRALRD